MGIILNSSRQKTNFDIKFKNFNTVYYKENHSAKKFMNYTGLKQ